MDKQYITRCGYVARILATDLKAGKPIAVAVVNADGKEEVFAALPSGHYHLDEIDHPYDLIEVPKAHTRWVIMSANGAIGGYRTKERAQEIYREVNTIMNPLPRSAAIVEIHFTEGEGL